MRRKLIFPLLTWSLALLLALAVAEGVLRVRHDGIEQITGVTEWRTGSYESITYYWDRYHPRLGWTNLPGYRSDERVPFRVTINDQGLRADREYAAEPAPGVTRIAMLGDSCTFGEEVDDHQTVPALLESRIPGSEVLNFGVHGYGAGQMLLKLEDEVLDYRPDVVVVVYLTFDIFRDTRAEFVHPKPVFALDGDEVQVLNVPVPELSRQSWLLRNSFTAAWLWGRPTLSLEDAANEDEIPLLAAILKRMEAACDRRGVPFVLVHIIDRNTLEAGRRPAVDTIRRVVTDSATRVLDLTGLLEQAYGMDPAGLTRPLGHWSEQGNNLIAGSVARYLRDEGLLD